MKKERKQSNVSQKCPVLTCRQVAGTGHYIEDKGLLISGQSMKIDLI